VIVWDAGSYRNLGKEPVERMLKEGHATVWLEGSKLRGGYALTRIGKGKSERWPPRPGDASLGRPRPA
jgi:hypothetical protein